MASNRVNRWQRTKVSKETIPAEHAGYLKVPSSCDVEDKAFMLSASQLEEWAQQGYIEIQTNLETSLHDHIICDADRVYLAAGVGQSQAYNSSPIGNNIYAAVPLLEKVFGCPAVDAAVRSILGDGYMNHPHRRPHHNDPGSRAQTLHRDSYFGFEFHRSHMPWWLMAMYYPQDVTADMAPTSVCPGTHFYAANGRFDERHLDAAVKDQQLTSWNSHEKHITCSAGTVVLLHNDLWHRGTANTSNKRRWMFCTMFVRSSAPSASLASISPTRIVCSEPGNVLWKTVLAFMTQSCMQSIDLNVEAAANVLNHSDCDKLRLEAAYMLAIASDINAGSRALCDAISHSDCRVVRAAKFATVVACRQQLSSSIAGAEMPLIIAYLLQTMNSSRDSLCRACCARSLFEHGSWCYASSKVRSDVATALVKYLRRYGPFTEQSRVENPHGIDNDIRTRNRPKIMFGSQNACAAILEALSVIPQTHDEPSSQIVAHTFASYLSDLGAQADLICGKPEPRSVGEVAMSVALGTFRFVSQCNTNSTWWPHLRTGLLTLVQSIALMEPPAGSRRAGSGGCPGFDQGLRYALGYSLEALLKSGDYVSFQAALSCLGSEFQGPNVEDLPSKLILRRCHLTTSQHTF
jgi:ectoine hydroxylase-related dioxygenase (phytanoyl-CoA dioxygenase family)